MSSCIILGKGMLYFMIIKDIREHLNKSQQEFAEMICVDIDYLISLENGEKKPSVNDRDKIYDLCLKNDVDGFSLILDNIYEIVISLKINRNKYTLYHGSNFDIKGIIKPNGRNLSDFGNGFYMHENVIDALSVIGDYDNSKLYILSIDTMDLKTYYFEDFEKWLMFIAYNRGKLNDLLDQNSWYYRKVNSIRENNDIIVGRAVDDCFFYFLDEFFEGRITDTVLYNSIIPSEFNRQFVAISDLACRSIRIEKEIVFSSLERMFINHGLKMIRDKKIDFARGMSKKYRRNGSYFDELIDEWEF